MYAQSRRCLQVQKTTSIGPSQFKYLRVRRLLESSQNNASLKDEEKNHSSQTKTWSLQEPPILIQMPHV